MTSTGGEDILEVAADDLVIETLGDLVPEILGWMADSALVVHTIEEYRVVPVAPTADDMWELGKLTSDRLAILMKVHRTGRAAGLEFENRAAQADRHFLLDGMKATSWHDVIVFEAVVGPFLRLFVESFFRSSHAAIDALARELWGASQQFIRFGQARMAKALAHGEQTEIEVALERWLPVTVRCIDELPTTVDETWRAHDLRTRSAVQVRQDFLDEIAAYLQGCDLQVPTRLRNAVCEAEVKWLGAEVASGGRRDGPLKAATFAFTEPRSTIVGEGLA